MIYLADVTTNAKGVPTWLEVIGAVVVVLSGILGLPVAARASKKAALENRKMQLEIEKMEADQLAEASARAQPALSRSAATLVGIEGYVVRFIILFVATAAWDIVASIVSPVLNVSLVSVASRSGSRLVEETLPAVISYFYAAGYIYIFVRLALPLLRDVLASQGLSLRAVFGRLPRPLPEFIRGTRASPDD